MQRLRPYVLCIGGFDPCGGAGVLADVKTLEQLKVLGLAVLTCNTWQTEDEFARVEWFRTQDVIRGIKMLMERYPVDFVKIGVVRNVNMLSEIVKEVNRINPNCKIIWDTVFGSTSGFDFFDFTSMEDLADILSNLYLITPNAMEYDILTGYGALNTPHTANLSLLKKAGHNVNNVGIDVLYTNNSTFEIGQNSERLPEKHGSGCVLASAITGYLVLGHELQEACGLAKKYIHRFLQSNTTLLGYHYD